MTREDFIFVNVQSTYVVTADQAKRILAAARAINTSTEFFSVDPDGTELTTVGDDYLDENGEHDVASALANVPDPEHYFGVELIQQVCSALSPEKVKQVTGHWPERWIASRDNE